MNQPPPSDAPQSQENELLEMAIACSKRHEYDQAKSFLHAILNTNSRHELAVGMLGAIHAETGRHDLAIECYRRVLAINPDNVLARFQIGELLLLMRKPETVTELWKPFLNSAEDFLAHYQTGLAYMQLQDWQNAQIHLNEASNRMPADYPLRAQLTQAIGQLPTLV